MFSTCFVVAVFRFLCEIICKIVLGSCHSCRRPEPLDIKCLTSSCAHGEGRRSKFFWRMCPRNSIVQNSSNLYPSHFCKRILQHVPSHSFLSFPQHTTFLPFLYMSFIVYHPPCDSNHGQNRPISTMFLPNFAKVQVGKTPELLPGQCPDPFPGARVARCRGPCHVRSRGACPEACPGACRATWAEAPLEH